jgi:hypothetical protein
MIELFKLHKLVNDYVLVQDIDLVRTLANEVLSDIDSMTNGLYSNLTVTPVNDTIQLNKSVNKLISVSLNGIKLKLLDNQELYQLKDTVRWQESPRYYVYAMTDPYTIKLISAIPDDHIANYKFTIEVLVKGERFITSSVNLPDYNADLLIKGILAKLMLHPKYLNPELANQYQGIYQTALNLWSTNV